jgi:streptogramin lyase
MPDFKGVVQIQDAANAPTIVLDGDHGGVTIGGSGQHGQLVVTTGGGVTRLTIDGATGTVTINAADGDPIVTVDGTEGDIVLHRKVAGTNREVFKFDSSGAALYLGGAANSGDLILRSAPNNQRIRLDGGQGDLTIRDAAGNTLFHFDSATAALWVGGQSNEGDVIVRDAANKQRVKLDGGEGDIWIKDANGNTLFHFDSANAALWLGGQGNEGDVIVRDAANRQRVKLDGGEGDIWVKSAAGHLLFHFDSTYAGLWVGGHGNEGDVIVRDAANKERVKLDGGEGDIWVKDAAGNLLFHFDSQFAALYLGGRGNEGDLVVRNGDGNQTIKLDGGQGDIILSNADAAEDFEVANAGNAAAGMVMVLAEDGRLEPCTDAYDQKVVGVISGAGRYRPGLVFDRGETPDDRRVPISVMGKVACRADAAYGRIRIGDLLTTSPSPGCAMKASDPARAFGSIIGKALSPLEEGEGLVGMLISLQ